MSQQTPQDHISKKKVVYTMPGVEAVTVRRDEEYRIADGESLGIDLYYPPGAGSSGCAPAVIFVTGVSDVSAQRMLGCRVKDMGAYVSWGRLTAASGMVAITYTNREPATDVHAVLQHVRTNGAALGVDGNRIGIWSCSSHVPTALSVLMQDAEASLKCAVLCYGYTLDSRDSTGVDAAVRRWGFANPSAGRSVDDLAPDVPLFVARAGLDQMPGLNDALDRFVLGALARNFPITLVNHATGPHAFDLFDDSEISRDIVRGMLAFLQFHLRD